MAVTITWTKEWTSSDDGTILEGSHLEDIQSDIADHSHTTASTAFLDCPDTPSSFVDQALKLVTVNLAANALEFISADRQYKVGTFTRVLSLGNGVQTIDGVGFTPKAIVFYACVVGAEKASWGFQAGFTNTTDENECIFRNYNGTADNMLELSAYSICIYGANASDHVKGYADNVTSDGFDIQWEVTGVQTETATGIYFVYG